ncbi:MAG: hypothetical protein AUI36_19285 [Cyanobacteria bacterium 13_1_40CM_2_61_4]|nr:MAG: hypothetical protein AUI36_19285 [Cyanobacteria bacterium 13_1_40CM_2_61_4]
MRKPRAAFPAPKTWLTFQAAPMCATRGTVVDVDSAPVYLDGHIWWHLSGRGWMAHEFLT